MEQNNEQNEYPRLAYTAKSQTVDTYKKLLHSSIEEFSFLQATIALGFNKCNIVTSKSTEDAFEQTYTRICTLINKVAELETIVETIGKLKDTKEQENIQLKLEIEALKVSLGIAETVKGDHQPEIGFSEDTLVAEIRSFIALQGRVSFPVLNEKYGKALPAGRLREILTAMCESLVIYESGGQGTHYFTIHKPCLEP